MPLLTRLAAQPVAQRRATRVLVLAPTRELAVQIDENVRIYSKHLPLTVATVPEDKRRRTDDTRLLESRSICADSTVPPTPSAAPSWIGEYTKGPTGETTDGGSPVYATSLATAEDMASVIKREYLDASFLRRVTTFDPAR